MNCTVPLEMKELCCFEMSGYADVTRMGNRRGSYREDLRDRDHLEDLSIDGG